MTKRRNPYVGGNLDLFEKEERNRVDLTTPKMRSKLRDIWAGDPATTPRFVPLAELSNEQIIELPVRAFSSDEWWTITKEQRRAIASNQTMTLEELVDEELWDWLGSVEQELILEDTSLDEAMNEPRIWEEVLDDGQREFLVENDDDAQKRIKKVVKYFVSAYEHAMEPDDDYIMSSFNDSDYFSQWLSEQADHLVDLAREHGHGDEIDSIVEEHTANGYTEQQVEQAIDEAMRETDVYDTSVSGDESGTAFFRESVSHGNLYVDVEGIYKLTSIMSEIELKLAITEINSATDNVYDSGYGRGYELTSENLQRKNHTFEREFEAYAYVDCEPDWSKISTAVEKILEDIEPEGEEYEGAEGDQSDRPAEKSVEDRTVYKFKDGFFVVELTPKEMVAEGAPYECPEHGPFYPPGEIFAGGKTAPCPRCDQGVPRCDSSLHMCIGSSTQRFVREVRKGKGKAWSLRTPAGKKKIAIFADLDGRGAIRRIDQAKGFGNRLPGFPEPRYDATGNRMPQQGKFKMDEVAKVAEFLASLSSNKGGITDPAYVNDLVPGLKEIAKKAVVENNSEAKKLVDKLATLSNRFGDIYDDVKEDFDKHARREDLDEPPRENPDDGPCPHCGGERGGFCG